jgi:hypothetical protein
MTDTPEEMRKETTHLLDKLVDVLHEEIPVVVHQQVQVDPLSPELSRIFLIELSG